MTTTKKTKDSGKKKKVNKTPFFHIGDLSGGSGRARAGTFVKTGDLTGAGEALTGSLNVVTRSTLKPRKGKPLVTSSDGTVYFKQHGINAQSQNAVASTRMARFVGMESVIAHNAFARINDVEGVVAGKVDGTPMMAGKWEREFPIDPNTKPEDIAAIVSMRQLVHRGGKYFERSETIFTPVDLRVPVVQKGLSDMQLFDALTGQVDRHGGNILINPETGVVTGIDDDASFREGQRANDVAGMNFKKDQYLGLPALVDARTAQLILDANPDELAGVLAERKKDTEALAQKDIDDAVTRLRAVQDYLQGLKDGGLLVTRWDETTYRQAKAQPTASYLGRQAKNSDDAADGLDVPTPFGMQHWSVGAGPPIPRHPTIVNPPVVPTTGDGDRQQLIGRRADTPVVAPSRPPRNTARRAVLFEGPPVLTREALVPRAAQARLGAQRVQPLPVIGDPDEPAPDTGGPLPRTDQDDSGTVDVDRLMADELTPGSRFVKVDPSKIEILDSDDDE